MFRKKKKEVAPKDNLKSTIDQDLIIHNMPKGSPRKKSSSLSFKSDNGSGSQELIKGESNDFKKIGVLIISLGVVLIGALVFLSYRYIIKPKAEPSPPAVNNVIPVEKENEAPQDIDIETEIDLDVNTSTEVSIDEDIIVVDDGENVTTSSDDVILDKEDDDEEENTIPFILLDTDGDLLYDDEEIILGTDIALVDTDADGYSDMQEIINNYNPIGPGPLKDNPNLSTYISPVANYSMLYPRAWTLASVNNDYTVVLTAGDGSIMQITVQPNIKMRNILAWYAENVAPGVPATNRLQSGSNWEGIISEDKRYFYLTDDSKENIYTISYEPIVSNQISYPNIFKLIINSFIIN